MGKRALFLFALLAVVMSMMSQPSYADQPDKHTYLYAVKDVDSLYLDHYVAPVDGKRPCVLFVFGGGFAKGNRDNKLYIPFFESLTEQGYDVVSIDYRLMIGRGLQENSEPSMLDFVGLISNAVNCAVEDMFSATNFLLERADEWQIDNDMIITCGSSAGAITVLQGEYAICNNLELAKVLPEGFNYGGVISFAGAVLSLSGKPQWAQNPAPMLLFHGNSDTFVPFEKAVMFGAGFYGSKYIVEQLAKGDSPYWFYTVNYGTHDMAGTPMYENRNEIFTFIDDMVRNGRVRQITTVVNDKAMPKRETKFKVRDYLGVNYLE